MDERNDLKDKKKIINSSGTQKRTYLIIGIVVVMAVAVALILLFATHIICIHKWQAATCTTPKTCSVCGKTEGEVQPHTWETATCTTPRTCKVCGETEGEVQPHKWVAATCTMPRTCKVCGETEGEVQPHTWVAATCTTPKTCSVCGETEGEALPHTWIDATCTAPKTCSICGKTEGEALGHDTQNWKIITEATCDKTGKKSAVCERCKEKIKLEIPKLEHTKGEWTVTKNYKVSREGDVTPGVETLTCSVCGTELETREYTIELSNSQKNAVICAYEEIPIWHPSYDYLINDLLVDMDGFSYEDAKFAADAVDVDWDEQAILYARQNSSGMSRAGLIEDMRYNKFTEEQIEKALKEVGY